MGRNTLKKVKTPNNNSAVTLDDRESSNLSTDILENWSRYGAYFN